MAEHTYKPGDILAVRGRVLDATWIVVGEPLDEEWVPLDSTPTAPWLSAEDQDALRDVLRDLIDTSPCRFDHHGYCQEHVWLTDERPCPHPRARALLAQLGEG